MTLGYNHNVRYKGEVIHVQTEDSGRQSPHIITLLYRGGTIIASKKTSYADIVKMENLGRIVEELMQDQHKEMLRRLKNGEYDEKLGFPVPTAPGSPAAIIEPRKQAASSGAGATADHRNALDELFITELVAEHHEQ